MHFRKDLISINISTLIQIPNAPIVPTHQLDEHVAHINALMDQSAAMDEQAFQQLYINSQLSSIMGQVQVHTVRTRYTKLNQYICWLCMLTIAL